MKLLPAADGAADGAAGMATHRRLPPGKQPVDYVKEQQVAVRIESGPDGMGRYTVTIVDVDATALPCVQEVQLADPLVIRFCTAGCGAGARRLEVLLGRAFACQAAVAAAAAQGVTVRLEGPAGAVERARVRVEGLPRELQRSAAGAALQSAAPPRSRDPLPGERWKRLWSAWAFDVHRLLQLGALGDGDDDSVDTDDTSSEAGSSSGAGKRQPPGAADATQPYVCPRLLSPSPADWAAAGPKRQPASGGAARSPSLQAPDTAQMQLLALEEDSAALRGTLRHFQQLLADFLLEVWKAAAGVPALSKEQCVRLKREHSLRCRVAARPTPDGGFSVLLGGMAADVAAARDELDALAQAQSSCAAFVSATPQEVACLPGELDDGMLQALLRALENQASRRSALPFGRREWP